MFNLYSTSEKVYKMLKITNSRHLSRINERLTIFYNCERRNKGYLNIYYKSPTYDLEKIPENYLYEHYKKTDPTEDLTLHEIHTRIDRSCDWCAQVPLYVNSSLLNCIFFTYMPSEEDIEGSINSLFISDCILTDAIKNDIKNIYGKYLIVLKDDEDCFSFMINTSSKIAKAGYRFVCSTNENKILQETLKHAANFYEQDHSKLSQEDVEYIWTGYIQKLDTYLDKISVILTENAKAEHLKTLNTLEQISSKYLQAYNETLSMIDNVSKQYRDLNIDNSSLKNALTKYKDKNIFTDFKEEGSSSISFYVNCELFNYNEIAAKKYNHSNEDLNKLIKDVFVDNKYSILLRTELTINLTSYNLNAGSDTRANYNLDSLERSKRNDKTLYNPHIIYYNCFGTNGPELTKLYKAAKHEEWCQALIACCGNLNFNDAVVTSKFIGEDLLKLIKTKDNNIKALKNNKTGEILTIDQYLKENENT